MPVFALSNNLKKQDNLLIYQHTSAFLLHSNDVNYDKAVLKFGTNQDDFAVQWTKKGYDFPLNKPIHVAITVNNHERIRLYLEGKKMVDSPRGFEPEMAKEFFFQALTRGGDESKKNYFYVSNVVIAETGVDERSLVMKELIEKGSFSTNEILFASGSDKIEKSSADILNQIGEAMQSVPNTQFLIIGHTDSDGKESDNQKLSQDRTHSVKNYLVEKFNIDANKLMCVGKGESEPVADNSTKEGKAQNRRVEFKKL